MFQGLYLSGLSFGNQILFYFPMFQLVQLLIYLNNLNEKHFFKKAHIIFLHCFMILERCLGNLKV